MATNATRFGGREATDRRKRAEEGDTLEDGGRGGSVALRSRALRAENLRKSLVDFPMERQPRRGIHTARRWNVIMQKFESEPSIYRHRRYWTIQREKSIWSPLPPI